MEKNKSGKWVISKADRQERRDRCKGFICRTDTMDAARKLAKLEGFSADTSVWIGAFSEILKERMR